VRESFGDDTRVAFVRFVVALDVSDDEGAQLVCVVVNVL
jgi:hypothetical protein